MVRFMTMTDTVMGSLLGQKSVSGDLLAMLVRDSLRGTTSIAYLARETGFSEAKALREVNRLSAAGLVVTESHGRYRHVALNQSSPYYSTVLEMLYLAYGVRPQTDPIRESQFELQVPFALVRLIPDELHPNGGRPYVHEPLFAGDSNDGPDLVQVRSWERTLSKLARHAGQIEAVLQDAYGTWKRERDRDLIHQLLHVGTGAAYAARVLAYMTSRSSREQYRVGPRPFVGRQEWQLALAATRAEAAYCREQSQSLEQAAQRAGDRTRRLMLIRELEQSLTNHNDRAVAHRDANEPDRADTADRLADQCRGEIDEHHAALASLEEALHGTYHNGGLGVSIDDVGTAGERMIIAQLHEIAETATAHAEAMQQVLS